MSLTCDPLALAESVNDGYRHLLRWLRQTPL